MSISGTFAYLRIASTYPATAASTDCRATCSDSPWSRARTTREATSRFTSHSNGPGSVSSKSRRSNDRLRSGVFHKPKLSTCASPHNCTVIPVFGVEARSAAITAAAPRKYVHGDAAIRPCRIGIRSGARNSFCAKMVASASWPRPAGFQSARARRGTTLRAERPSPARSGLRTVARSLMASGVSGIGELSQPVAVLVAFQPGAQAVGGVADDTELLGDLDGGRAAPCVAGVDRSVDGKHLAHLRRQLRVDLGELGIFEVLKPDAAGLGGTHRSAGRLVRDPERN